ncbi:MAG: YkgJ family cysteine cluster protein [Deltaproteobacteria bacterium]|nr:YkgJ family cysteine cluster protein [Deltaproteobacteria bacterium]
MKPKGAFKILTESVVQRPDLAPAASSEEDAPDAPEENPYWTFGETEADEHPDPSKGCVRRGLCCKSSPGWFAPGEVEAAAALKGMEPDAFVRKYLIIDAITVDDQVVHVFAPMKLGRDGKPALPPASRADDLYRALRGQCVFYGLAPDGLGGCGIYEARPTECRLYICTNAPADNPTHEQIARLWKS